MQQTVNVILSLVNRFSGPASQATRSVKRMEGGLQGLMKRLAYVNQSVQLVVGAFRTLKTAITSTGQVLIGAIGKFNGIKLSIGGALAAFELVPDFKAGQKAAESLYYTLERLSAPLPGSADDFVQVFQTSLPLALDAFKSTGKASLKEIATFTSRFAAVAIANGIQAVQVASDLPRILGGSAGIMLPTFRKLLPLIRKAGADIGIAIKGTKDLNKLTSGQRLQVLQQVIKLSGGAINAFSSTIGAATGTLGTYTAALKRAAGAPLYKAYVEGLQKAIAFFKENQEVLGSLAVGIGNAFAGIYRGFQYMMTGVINTVAGIPILQDLAAIFAGGGGGGLTQTLGVISDAMFSQLRGVIEFVAGAFAILAPVVAALTPIVAMASFATRYLVTYLGAMAGAIGDTILPVVGFVFKTMEDLMGELRPVFAHITETGRMLGEALGRVFGTVLNVVLLGLSGAMTVLKYTVVPIISVVGLALRGLANAIVGVINFIGNYIPGMRRVKFGFKAGPGKAGDAASVLRNLFGGAAAGGGPADAIKKKTKTPKGRASQNFDFRHSKFDITQQFAEGFDPDRIASAFATDLGKLGEMRAQSNMSPVFALR